MPTSCKATQGIHMFVQRIPHSTTARLALFGIRKRTDATSLRGLVLALTIATSFSTAAQQSSSLTFGTACNNVAGAFTHKGLIYMDDTRIYAASVWINNTGILWVLDRNRPCQVIESRMLNTAGLGGVNGNSKQLFVSGLDGNVWTFNKTNPLTLVSLKQVSQYSLTDIQLMGVTVYTGFGSVNFAVDSKHIYMSVLNSGDVVQAVKKNSTTPIVYGSDAVQGETAIYDLHTGNLVSTITNPNGALAVTLHVDKDYLAITSFATPGVYLYDTGTLQQIFVPRSYANVVETVPSPKPEAMIVGDEYGMVGAYSMKSSFPLLTNLDLRSITGDTRAEAIEIRDLFVDPSTGLVIAGSSGGNDTIRVSGVPPYTLFYLKFQ